MTDQEQPTETPEQPSEIEKLRNEFQEQFATLKTSFESELKKSSEENAALRKENEELHRALVRSAQLPPQQAPVQKTEQEIYADRINALAAKSLAIEKERGP